MAIRRASSYVVVFAAIDPTDRPSRKSGLTSWASSEVQLSKDGGSFANSTNSPTELGSTGRYALTLTAAEMDASSVHLKIEKSGMDPYDHTIGTTGHKTGAVVSDAGNTSSTFKTNLSESSNDHWKDALLVFTTGSLLGQVKKITAFNATTDFVTVSPAFTAAPSAGDLFIVIDI